MHDIMPKKLISRNDVNNWEQYANNLEQFRFVKKYLLGVFIKWVEKQENPLEIIWIQDLFLSRLKHLENNLISSHNILGENNLLLLLEEITKQGGKPKAINEKINSIQSEIITYFELEKFGHRNIRKIYEIGDWESDSSIISVKSITNLNSNYQLVENKIRGMHFLEENEILRKYNHIWLINQKNLDYKFMDHITDFLERSFISTIAYTDSVKNNNGNFIHLFETFFDKNDSMIGHMKIEIYPQIIKNTKSILFIFTEERPDESTDQIHQLYIKLNDESDTKNIFGVSNDNSAFFSGEKIMVEKQVESKLRLFDKTYRNINSDKQFIGWINIPIAINHQEYVANNHEKLKHDFSLLTKNREYQVVLCLIPHFISELKDITSIIL